MSDVAVIGAGAIAQQAYLPAISELPGANLRRVVDVDESRARQTAREFGADGHASDHRDVLEEVDAAVVSTPPKFHAEIARSFLESDTHVFTEKPIALTGEEGAELVTLAETRDLHYAVSRQFRESPACRLLYTFTHSGLLGELERMDVRFGDTTSWEFQSDYRLQHSLAGGGVLTDKGPHVLDLAVWLLGEEYDVVEYRDDSFGGLEANARLEMRFEGVEATFEIAGTRNVDNEVAVTGERAELVADPGSATATLSDRRTGERVHLEPEWADSTGYLLRVATQAKRFVESVDSGEPSYVPASNGLAVLELVEACYDRRERLVQPWDDIGVGEVS